MTAHDIIGSLLLFFFFVGAARWLFGVPSALEGIRDELRRYNDGAGK